LPTESLVFAASNKNALDASLMDDVKKVIHQLEMDWKHDAVNGVAAVPAQANVPAAADPSVQNQLSEMAESAGESPAGTIPVTVPIATLAQWAQIQRKINTTRGVEQVNVVSLQRGAVSIMIQYHGNLEDLQTMLLQRNLQLKEDTLSGAWFLNPF
jgi:hypothetical protein